MMTLKRRHALLTALFGAGYVGLRAMATGLPAWFIANPRRATAQDLNCATPPQFLIVSVASAGDPMNCNCPGTYGTAAIHPEQVEMLETPVTLGGVSYGAALPWASTTAGGKLSDATLARINFFHHVTLANNHGDQPGVMRLMGAMDRAEMLVSAYAKHLAPCLGTIQTEPVSVGAGGNASELLSFGGRALPSISPTQLVELLTGTSGRSAGDSAALIDLRSIRDKHLDRLNALAKTDATQIQQRFIDMYASSQVQVRDLSVSLADTIADIQDDGVEGQALAATMLIQAKVSPVITLRIPFGGDNHDDAALQNEVDDHTDVGGSFSGVAGIQRVMDALTAAGLQDSVTFATLNVFGRNLNGIDKVEGRSGRDHYGNHSVAVLIGKNIRAGVVGGVVPVDDRGSSGALGAGDIDSATGAVVPSGGDIPRLDTHLAMARTLGVALGIPEQSLTEDLITDAGGKVVPAALIA
jgi:Protein of unknown function (DUF1501)